LGEGRPDPDGVDVAVQAKGKKGKKAKEEPKRLEVDVGGGVKMKFVLIEPGKFTMGSPKSEGADYETQEKQHKVEITRPFYMGVFTVTQQEYEQVMGKNPSNFCAAGGGKDRVAGLDTASFPVEFVSWNDAAEFCKKLSEKTGKKFDLPTEAEWEYACRAGTKGPFHFGDSLSSKQANFDGNRPYGGAAKAVYLERTAKVGSYKANAFGLFDMHGNVWQWCKDNYSDDYYKDSPVKDPQGPANSTSRALRGGSWSYDAKDCRSAFRGHGEPDGRYDAGSFRVVMRPELRLNPIEAEKLAKAPEPKKLKVDLGGGVEMKLVYIEPGKFMMGSPKSEQDHSIQEKQHEVEITRPFYMGVFTVTQQEYELVMGKNPSHACATGAHIDTRNRVAGLDTTRFPVENVSWNDAMEFCKKLSQRTGKEFDLPTEAEWEYTCRGGTKGPFHFGDSLSSKQANFNGDQPYGAAAKAIDLKRTAKVGSYEANSFGLFDMHGNVRQWCKDYYKEDYYKDSPVKDPQGPAEGKDRVLRGGSFDWGATYCRSARRDFNPPGAWDGRNGFRVVVRLSMEEKKTADNKEANKQKDDGDPADQAVIDRLIQVLKDPATPDQQRLSACEALGKRGTKAQRAAPELVRYLGQVLEKKAAVGEGFKKKVIEENAPDGDELTVIVRATLATGASGKEYTALLARIMNLRWVVKKGVAEVADEKGGKKRIDKMGGGYTLEDPRSIFVLVGETLGQLGTQDAFSALQKAAKVGSPSRSAAIVGLARIANGPDKILKANAEVELQVLAESDPDAKIRGEAARSNGGDPAVDEAVTDRLIDFVKDAALSKEQRLSACEALGKRGTKAKRAAPEVAKYLGQALEGNGGAFEEELRKILRAAIATGANGKDFTASLDRIFYVGLNRTAPDQTPITVLAGETLGQLGTEEAFALLQKAAKREKHIRSAAIAGFASAAKSQDKTLKAKAKVELQVLAETDPDVQIRAEAVRAIAVIEGRVKDDGKK
jgi:formylglycine-generating enzyme required for sulfatase activity/HEAT repeat protein